MNRDKTARRVLLLHSSRLDRLEATIEQMTQALTYGVQSSAKNVICTKCNIYLYDDYVCQLEEECPHGLDPD